MPWHLTPAENIKSICENGLKPLIGPRSEMLGEDSERVYMFSSFADFTSADSWLFDAFEDDTRLALFYVRVPAQDGAWTEVDDPIPASSLSLISPNIDFLTDSPAYDALDKVIDPFGALEDFRATRTAMSAHEYGDLVQDAQWVDDAGTFLVYGATFYIEAMPDGSFQLPLVHDTFVANTPEALADLEEKLFDYMISERAPAPEGPGLD